jgi:hypothetical protein
MLMMNNKFIVQHQQNDEVKILLIIIISKTQSPSLFGTDSTPCMNDSNRSYSRTGDFRLPSLIETPGGRRITYKSHLEPFFFLHITNKLSFVCWTSTHNREKRQFSWINIIRKLSLSITRKRNIFLLISLIFYDQE